MSKKRIDIFDIDKFIKENKELVEKYMAKDTMSLVIEDIPIAKHELLDNRVGIPSRNFDYKGLTLAHKLEIIKCRDDELYFIEKYIKILTLDHGEQPFKLWDYQKELIKAFEKNRFVLSVQSRQSGKTQTTAAHLTHRMTFFPAKKIAILANKFSQSKEIMSRVQMSFERLPVFLKKPVKSFTKVSIEFEDLTEIFSAASEGSGIRGKSVTDLYWDESAFTNNDWEFWEANYPIISSGKTSRIIVTSTPNGQKGVFYNLYRGGKDKTNSFKVIEVPYTRVPIYNNEKFRTETIRNIGEDSFAQEYACSFNSASGALISSAVQGILKSKTPLNNAQIVKSGDPMLRIFEQPKKDHTYCMTIDCAEGLGQDYSTFVIFDVTKVPYKVVASYRNNSIAPQLFPIEIMNAAQQYNNSWILCELNSAGAMVINDVFNDYEYDNIIRVGKNRKTGVQEVSFYPNASLGLKTTYQSKRVGCSSVKTLIETGKLVLNDHLIIDEFSTFVARGKSYQADDGCHDDMAMCCVIFAWLASQDKATELFNSSFKKELIEEYTAKGENFMVGIFVSDGLDEEYDRPKSRDLYDGFLD